MKRALQHSSCIGIAVALAVCAIAIGANSTMPAGASDAEDADTQSERLAMAGLPGVRVVVADLNQDFKSIGLTRELIQSKVELQLRRLGVRVLSKDEWLRSERGPYLHISITGGQMREQQVFYFSADASLSQVVRTVGTDVVIGGITWEDGGAGYAGQNVCKKAVLEYIDDKVGMFANEFLAANPPAATQK
jgi:hypothetical protein